MLEIRPSCEHCNKALLYNSNEAMICTFECTYCRACAQDLFKNVCPNCTGNLTQRPIRPSHHLEKNPVSTFVIHKPKDFEISKKQFKAFGHIHPQER